METFTDLDLSHEGFKTRKQSSCYAQVWSFIFGESPEAGIPGSLMIVWNDLRTNSDPDPEDSGLEPPKG